jgi:hypothetical protein
VIVGIMRGTRALLLLFVLAAGCGRAFGRLGESSQAIEQRYGAPLTTGSLTGFTECTYEKESFMITVFYQNGVSVLEKFASRGLDQASARQVVVQIAARSIGSPDATEECQIRQASGITTKDEVFWTWKNAAQKVNAAFNPVECTLAFFADPAICPRVQHALESAPLPGD